MTVAELIAALSALPQDAEVACGSLSVDPDEVFFEPRAWKRPSGDGAWDIRCGTPPVYGDDWQAIPNGVVVVT